MHSINDAIEDVVPENSIDFIAESSLSLLSEPHVKRLNRNDKARTGGSKMSKSHDSKKEF